MTLIVAKPPDSDLKVLTDTLGELLPSSESTLGGASLDIRHPVPIYSIDLQDAATESLSAAKLFSWRYLLIGPDAVATADVDSRDESASSASGGSGTFSNLSHGPMASKFKEALTEAEKWSAPSKRKYDLRALEVPSLYLGAIWLSNSDESIFIPYLDKLRLSGKNPRPDTNFLTELQERAKQRLSEGQSRPQSAN
jgi:hypothetical protein